MYIAKIHVTYKPSILDPQAVAIKDAMNRLEFDDVENVVQGKYFEITLNNTDILAAQAEANAVCEKLLVNPTMETYTLELEEAADTLWK